VTLRLGVSAEAVVMDDPMSSGIVVRREHHVVRKKISDYKFSFRLFVERKLLFITRQIMLLPSPVITACEFNPESRVTRIK
jgi:hypothetical protein